MTSPDPTTQIAGLGLEPTYSAREAALLLGGRTPGLISGRTEASSSGLTVPSCSRCEQRAGYRRFTLAMLEDIASAVTEATGSRWAI
jgi:hypothetical protein